MSAPRRTPSGEHLVVAGKAWPVEMFEIAGNRLSLDGSSVVIPNRDPNLPPWKVPVETFLEAATGEAITADETRDCNPLTEAARFRRAS